MMTYTFTGPKVKATRKGPCPTCGKTTSRSYTFENTVNPLNRKADGTPKSWAEVRADVKAQADAWDPDPSVFEHAACEAERLAPPVADKVPLDEEDAARTEVLRLLMADVILWLEAAGVPCSGVTVGLDHHGKPTAKVVEFLAAHHIPMWARALGLDTVRVDEHGGATYVRMAAEVRGMAWSASGTVYAPEVGDRLGGADVQWSRDKRTKRKTGYGTVSVDELTAGLLRMGIAVVTS